MKTIKINFYLKRIDPTIKEATTFIKPHKTPKQFLLQFIVFELLFELLFQWCQFQSFITYPTGPYNALKMVVKTQKLCFWQFQMTVMQQAYMIKLIQLLICVPNVVYYCKLFTISVLINPFCDTGAAKYRYQTGALIFLQFSISI